MIKRVHQILEASAKRWPDHPAIINGASSISYSDLWQLTQELKSELQKAGLSKGQGLGVMGRNGGTFVAAMFAGMACDATVLPLSHQLKQAELDIILSETGLHAVLDDGASVNKASMPVKFQDQNLSLSWTAISAQKTIVDSFDAAFIRYTSGTTGQSKGVVLSHQRVIERVEAAQAALSLKHSDIVLWVLPMAFHFLVTIILYLYRGATIVITENILAETLINEANKHQATFLYAAPMHYRLLAADQSGKKLDTIRRAISTSSAIPNEIAHAFTDRFGLSVTQAYGIIEAGLPMLDYDSDFASPETVGSPAPGFDIGIFDEDNHAVKTGQSGRLAIRGPGLFDAYLKPWQLSSEVMENGWFMTGDLAQRQANGKIIICGREKSMINVSGNKAFPEEIEAVLNSYPEIEGSRVFGQPHPLMGEIVCADICLSKGKKLDIEAILLFCREQLSTYKVPQRLYEVNYIGHTLSGKVQREV
jgi:acyl-CoA synthetase (AMP-forming)/AMP-acid ligase II